MPEEPLFCTVFNACTSRDFFRLDVISTESMEHHNQWILPLHFYWNSKHSRNLIISL